jgi:hypothetical protein
LERRLRELAAAVGEDPSSYVEHLIQAELAADEDRTAAAKLSPSQRIAELETWAGMNPTRSYEADDSREAIYED